jgi:hypothetical protein
VNFQLQVDVYFEQGADHFVFLLLLLLGVRQCQLHPHECVVVELVPDEYSHDGRQFLQQFFLDKTILPAKLRQSFALIVGINRTAFLELHPVDRTPDLDDLQGRKCYFLLLFELAQLLVQQFSLPVALVPKHSPDLVVEEREISELFVDFEF